MMEDQYKIKLQIKQMKEEAPVESYLIFQMRQEELRFEEERKAQKEKDKDKNNSESK